MSRFALAFAAIVILALSAGLTGEQPRKTPPSTDAASAAVFHENRDPFRAELSLMKRDALPGMARRASDEEPPAPALLIYSALILVGSAVSVVLAHRRLRREG